MQGPVMGLLCRSGWEQVVAIFFNTIIYLQEEVSIKVLFL